MQEAPHGCGPLRELLSLTRSKSEYEGHKTRFARTAAVEWGYKVSQQHQQKMKTLPRVQSGRM